VTHWAARYVGTPWVPGVSDCWNFARTAWREQFGWEVPQVAVNAADPRAARRAFAAGQGAPGWAPVAGDLREGDGVLMARGRHPCHVGVLVELPEGRAVLHSVEGAGVVVTPLQLIGALGYRVAGIYRRQTCAPR
jgi:cell wall-associated NlpC family hydrolase